MKVKICGIRNETDLKNAVSANPDAVGFLVGQLHPSPDFILPGTAARLVRQLPPYLEPVLVTHYTDPEEIFDLVVQTGIISVQLHGGSTPDQVSALRDLMPPAGKLTLSVHFQQERDFPDVMEYYRLVNAFLLDSMDKETGKVGGTGKVGDWNLARKFVAVSPVPVVLAGGLCGENAAAAVKQVRPFALDANSGLKDASGAVDSRKCRDFVQASYAADFN